MRRPAGRRRRSATLSPDGDAVLCAQTRPIDRERDPPPSSSSSSPRVFARLPARSRPFPFHLFSLFLLRPRVRLSPFMASFPPSLFLFPLPPPTFRPSAPASLRQLALPLPPAPPPCPPSLARSSSPPPPTCPPSPRRPPPFQLDSLAANPLSVGRRRSCGACLSLISSLCAHLSFSLPFPHAHSPLSGIQQLLRAR